MSYKYTPPAWHNNIMHPMHPLSPVNPASPLWVGKAHRPVAPTVTTDGRAELQLTEGQVFGCLYILLAVVAIGLLVWRITVRLSGRSEQG